MVESLTIIGASVRAAAASAARAGISVRAADLFADEDLRALGPAKKVDDYPDEFEQIIRAAPDEPWMYTGGLENYPQLVQRLENIAPLLGNPAHVLRRVRDPLQVAQALVEASIPCPKVAMSPAAVPGDGVWMRKPLRSAGGATIEIHRGVVTPPIGVADGYYYQEYIAGRPMSAVFAASDEYCVLLGITRQLVGRDWNGNDGFRYAGSIGPLDEPRHIAASFEHLGRTLAGHFHLRGVFGIDAIARGENVWPIEINPRFPASAELLDWALDVSTVGLHVDPEAVSDFYVYGSRSARMIYGKAIVYAERALTIGDQLTPLAAQRTTAYWPAMADIPAVGANVAAGHPVVTVFAAAEHEQAVLLALKDRVACVSAALNA